jgi:signal recognition particle subunit SEC65
MNEPTLDEMVACAERELAMRERVYPRWVESGKMTADKAEKETQCMKHIASFLARKRDEANGQGELSLN